MIRVIYWKKEVKVYQYPLLPAYYVLLQVNLVASNFMRYVLKIVRKIARHNNNGLFQFHQNLILIQGHCKQPIANEPI